MVQLPVQMAQMHRTLGLKLLGDSAEETCKCVILIILLSQN